MLFRQLFDPTSATYTYLLADEDTREAVIIDPVIDQLGRDTQMAFTGDALLIRGSGRSDLQHGNGRKLYHSVHEKIFTLADDAIVYPGHDCKGRMRSSVGEEKRWNPRLGQGKTIEQYTENMAKLLLPPPKQLAVAVPANLHCGVPQGVAHDAKAPREALGTVRSQRRGRARSDHMTPLASDWYDAEVSVPRPEGSGLWVVRHPARPAWHLTAPCRSRYGAVVRHARRRPA